LLASLRSARGEENHLAANRTLLKTNSFDHGTKSKGFVRRAAFAERKRSMARLTNLAQRGYVCPTLFLLLVGIYSARVDQFLYRDWETAAFLDIHRVSAAQNESERKRVWETVCEKHESWFWETGS